MYKTFVYNAGKSGFYDVMGQSFLNAGALATTTMYIGERSDKKGVLFRSIHPRDLYLEESADGDINTVHRILCLSAKNIVELFPEGKFSDDLRKAIKETPDQIFEILHVVQPRKNRDKTKLDNTNMTYESVYIEVGKQNIIFESGYDTFPYPTWRWQKKEGSAYGTGQSHLALPEIKKANLISKTLLQVAERASNPPVNIPHSMRGKVKLTPKGKNYYDDNRPQAVITPIHMGESYPIGVDREDRIKQVIKEYYFVDMFISFLRANGQMTATEVMERQSEKASVLSNVISRLSTEFMNPIFDRLWEIEQVSGRLPEPPAELEQFAEDGKQIKIDYISPLAIAQRKAFKTQSITEAVNGIAPLLQIQPSVGDNIDWDKLAREQLLATGMDISILRPKDKVEEMRKAKAEMQQQQMLQQQQMNEAEMINKLKGSKAEERILSGQQ